MSHARLARADSRAGGRWTGLFAACALLLSVAAMSAPAAAVGAAVVSDRANGGTGVRIAGQVVSPDSAWVVYRVDRTFTRTVDLYAVHTEGGIPVRLNGTGPSSVGNVSEHLVSADSGMVVFWAQPPGAAGVHLFATPMGGGPVVRLDAGLLPETTIANGLIAPDSTRVVYTATHPLGSDKGVYSVPITGGPAVSLSGSLTPSLAVPALISPDSSTVVFGATRADGATDLYAVAIGGGTPVQLNVPVPVTAGVRTALITPTGASVVFIDESTGPAQVRFVPIGGGAPVLLSGAPSVGPVAGLRIAPDSSRVVFGDLAPLGQLSSLYSVPVGGGAPTSLTTASPPIGAITCPTAVQITPDSARVVFVAEAGGLRTLYASGIGGGAPVALSTIEVRGACGENVVVAPNSSRVVYLGRDATDLDHLFSVSVTGGPSVRIDVAGDGRVAWPFVVTSDSARVVYLADPRRPGMDEVFSVLLSGGSTLPLNGALPLDGRVDLDVQVTPDARYVVYVADQTARGLQQLFTNFVSEVHAGAVGLTIPVAASVLVPTGPVRVFDSRPGEASPEGSGALTGLIGAGQTIEVPVAGYAGVPSDAVAVALNVTATDTVAPGFVTIWPTGVTRPLASSLNVTAAGQTRANLVITPLGLDGRVSMYAQSGTHLVADVVGFFRPAAGPVAGGRLLPRTPARVFDTRATEPAAGPKGLVPAGGTITVAVSRVAGVPSDAAAVVLNVTATDALGPGFVTVWPSGAPRPLASTLNLPGVGATASNLAIVPLGAGGRIELFSQRGANLLADVTGYVTSAASAVDTAGLYVPLSPIRAFDSRTATPPTGPTRFIGAGETVSVQLADALSVPSHAGLLAVNMTATDAATGFVTVFLGPELPLVSSLNLEGPGDTRANAAMVAAGEGGALDVFVQSGANIVLDLTGYTLP